MTIDFNKPVQTRDGRPVTILTTRARGDNPVMGYVGDGHTFYLWSAEGRFYSIPSVHDLMNAPDPMHYPMSDKHQALCDAANSEPASWISRDAVTGAIRYNRVTIQSLRPGVYKHEPLYSIDPAAIVALLADHDRMRDALQKIKQDASFVRESARRVLRECGR